MRRASLLLLALAAAPPAFLLDGCFTEVGNAEGENRIRADFRIDYVRKPLPKRASSPHDTVAVNHFYLLVREAEYHLKGGGERHLWRESDSGLAVDFTGGDKLAALPARPIEPDSIVDFTLNCSIPDPPPLAPDTLDLAAFREKGYIKGIYVAGKDTIPFLFALPATEYLHIRYAPSVLETWRKGNAYEMQVIFYALKWVTHAGLETADRSKDRAGRPFVLIDAGHNAGLHRTLADRFLTSFNTDQVESG